MTTSYVIQRVRVHLGRVRMAIHGVYYYVPGLHRPTTPLLILGHMRCGSTLLAHLLNSHPEVAGYGETHRSYSRPQDLRGLRAHVFVRQPTLRIRARYVTDKNVNEVFPVEPTVFRDSTARVVFIAREPVRSMSSLLQILPDWTEEQALAHYLCRMELMTEMAKALSGSGRAFFLTHHQLIHHSEAALSALTRFLDLRIPLSERYEFASTTGEWGWGDTSERIWAGRIVRDYAPPERPLQPETVRVAEDSFAKVVTAMQGLADHLSASSSLSRSGEKAGTHSKMA